MGEHEIMFHKNQLGLLAEIYDVVHHKDSIYSTPSHIEEVFNQLREFIEHSMKVQEHIQELLSSKSGVPPFCKGLLTRFILIDNIPCPECGIKHTECHNGCRDGIHTCLNLECCTWWIGSERL